MSGQISNPRRCARYAFGLAITALVNSAAVGAEEWTEDKIACAEQEALLNILVEAHGAAPSVATEKLASEAVSLTQMRTACDYGPAREAAALYDPLIADLTASLHRKN